MKQYYYMEDNDPTSGNVALAGPFPTIEKAKAHVRETTADAWVTSCGCLREEWTCEPVHVFELVGIFTQNVKPKVTVTLHKERTNDEH